MKDKKERGAIVVEATISFTTFIFAILTVMLIIELAYAQAKIGTALDYASKQMSQYCYLYFKIGADEWDSNLSSGTANAEELAHSTVDGYASLVNGLSDTTEDIQQFDFDGVMENVRNGSQTIEDLYNNISSQISQDPQGFALSMGQLAVSEFKEEAKVIFARTLAKTFMKKNLKAYEGQDVESFLANMHVKRKEGETRFDSLSFDGTYMLPHGSNSIQLVCTYELEVLKFLNLDYSFKITQVARTAAWGNGISQINEQSIWDTLGPLDRGRYIVADKKEAYPYTAYNAGFDALEGNTFISIISIDNITYSSYGDPANVQRAINNTYTKMYDKVSGLSNEVTVYDSSGNRTTVESDPSSRQYRMVVVIPDGADESVINQGISQFQSQHPECAVRLVHGYGTPTSNSSSGASSEAA
ncbi:MAG: hypothetical protein IJ806_10005 [Ruminococcus sp.]|nr:hypothetical protein [Ruminococcus sp.]